MLKVLDFYEKIDRIAPFKSSYQWDNTGLLIGNMNAPVKKILLTLDVTNIVVEYAVSKNIDLIISHHPVIFQGIKSINQKKLLKLIENKIAVISAHTNLDVSKIGVNYLLAEKLEMQNIKPLSMSQDITQYQINVYIPDNAVEKVVLAMHEAGAGLIGNYSHCAVYFDVLGQYVPLDGSHPFIGEINNLEKVKERKVEIVCEEINLQKVIKAMLGTHPYETPVYTIVQLKQKSMNYGLGCYGELVAKTSLKDLGLFVKEELRSPFVKLWTADKAEDYLVNTVAVCGGSGNSIINEAKQYADVFVSADFTYHQFLDAPMPVIDAGHFFTENPVLERLKDIFKDFDCEIMQVSKEEHDIKNLTVII